MKSVSAQSEDAIKQLAETVRTSKSRLADFLLYCLYVDDMGESKGTEEECFPSRPILCYGRTGVQRLDIFLL